MWIHFVMYDRLTVIVPWMCHICWPKTRQTIVCGHKTKEAPNTNVFHLWIALFSGNVHTLTPFALLLRANNVIIENKIWFHSNENRKYSIESRSANSTVNLQSFPTLNESMEISMRRFDLFVEQSIPFNWFSLMNSVELWLNRRDLIRINSRDSKNFRNIYVELRYMFSFNRFWQRFRAQSSWRSKTWWSFCQFCKLMSKAKT